MKKEQQGKNQPEEISRRKFIGGAGLIVGGAALLNVSGLAIYGYSVSKGDAVADDTCTTTTTTTTTTQENVEYWGECICPNCGIGVSHPKGIPCRLVACPKCETNMVRSVSV